MTIIFTPLTFVVSLFALPLDRGLQNQFQFGGTNGINGVAGTEASAAFTSHFVGRGSVSTMILYMQASLMRFCWPFCIGDGDAFLGSHLPHRDTILVGFGREGGNPSTS